MHAYYMHTEYCMYMEYYVRDIIPQPIGHRAPPSFPPPQKPGWGTHDYVLYIIFHDYILSVIFHDYVLYIIFQARATVDAPAIGPNLAALDGADGRGGGAWHITYRR